MDGDYLTREYTLGILQSEFIRLAISGSSMLWAN